MNSQMKWYIDEIQKGLNFRNFVLVESGYIMLQACSFVQQTEKCPEPVA